MTKLVHWTLTSQSTKQVMRFELFIATTSTDQVRLKAK